FFATNIGAVAVEGMQLEAELRAKDVVTQKACSTRLLEGFLKACVDLEDLTVDVVVAHGNTHGIRCDRHTFNHDMGIEAQDVPVFESSWLALVGITDEKLLARQSARHEAPLEPGRKACTSAAAQGGRLEFGDHIIRRHARRENPTQCLVAAALDVVFQTPVTAIQAIKYLRLYVTAVKDHAGGEITAGIGVQPLGVSLQNVLRAHADSPCFLSSSIISSILGCSMRTHI